MAPRRTVTSPHPALGIAGPDDITQPLEIPKDRDLERELDSTEDAVAEPTPEVGLATAASLVGKAAVRSVARAGTGSGGGGVNFLRGLVLMLCGILGGGAAGAGVSEYGDASDKVDAAKATEVAELRGEVTQITKAVADLRKSDLLIDARQQATDHRMVVSTRVLIGNLDLLLNAANIPLDQRKTLPRDVEREFDAIEEEQLEREERARKRLLLEGADRDTLGAP